MTMDFLDEETIEVSRDDAKQSHLASLASSSVLKNREYDLTLLANIKAYNNPLLNAGAPLLATCVALSRMPLPDDMYRFRKTLIEQITQLKQQVSSLDYPQSVADKCCFIFCIALDEFILHSQWGEDCHWENNTIVSDLFGVRNGGEQFFLVAEKALQQPKVLSDILELIYILIKIGFRGQYRLQGREQLEEIMYRLEQAVFKSNPAISLSSLQSAAVTDKAKPRSAISYSLQMVLFVSALIFLVLGSYYWFESHRDTQAAPFNDLAAFNIKHLQGGKSKEAIYISMETEMRASSENQMPNLSRVKTAAKESALYIEPRLTIEIAAFVSRIKAFGYLRSDKVKPLNAQVIFIRGKYRVVIQSESEQQAQALSDQLQSLGFNNVFYYYYVPEEAPKRP